MIELLEVTHFWVLVVMFLSLILLMFGFIKTIIIYVIKGFFQFSSTEKKILTFLSFLFIFSLLIEKYSSYFILNKIQIMLEDVSVEIKNEKGIELNKIQFVKDFSKISAFKQSGSSPEDSFYLSIITQDDKLIINLKRDSREKKLYWVFYPGYPYSGNLGYLETGLLSTRSVTNGVRP